MNAVVETEKSEIVPWMQAIASAKAKFIEIDTLDWESESIFIMQAITKSDGILDAAMKNPASVRNTVASIAAVGLSINPATKYAYLTPKDGGVNLEISYIGLVKLATDTGSIMWVQADLVYESDQFAYNGPATVPTHTGDVFSKDRGEMIGVYCIAKTVDGDHLVETMSAAELDDIKNKSKGNTSKYSPWITFKGEMWKKAVIKRASKTWPKTERSDRFEQAVHILNESEGLEDKYLSSGHQMVGTEPIDHIYIEERAQLCREIVDEDDEETGPDKANEIIQALSNDERMELFNKLKVGPHPLDAEGKEIRKTYASCLTGHINIYKDRQKNAE